MILGRKAEVGNAIVENIKAKGGEAMFLVTNVLDEAVLKQNLEDILAKYGRVDALLNAAGGNMPGATIAPTGTFFDLKVDEFQKVLNLNLTGTVLPTQVFLKPMVEQKKGAIVNFSSMAAFRPMTRVCGYAAAKAGMIGMSKSVAREVASRGVTVNCVAPGFIETDMTAALPEDVKTHLMAQIPAARLGKTDDIAAAVLYLASEPAGYVTGTVLHVNGGMFMG